MTGGIIKLGGVLLASFSKMQQSTALSSGESELMAMTSVAAEGMYWQGLLEEIGHGHSMKHHGVNEGQCPISSSRPCQYMHSAATEVIAMSTDLRCLAP